MPRTGTELRYYRYDTECNNTREDNYEKHIAIIFIITALVSLPLAAQHAGGNGSALAKMTVNPPVQAYGSFIHMQHCKDYTPKDSLDEAIDGAGWYGVGALADLAGEITIHDGAIFLSYGRSMDGRIAVREAGDAQGTLLAAARVSAWREITLPGPIDQASFHNYIIGQAQAAGLDTEAAFPFLIRGDITNYRWHVLAEPNPHFGRHGSGAHMARQFDTEGARMTAEVVGFYSGSSLEGVISHPGEKFHAHVLDPVRTLTGHLDAYDIDDGAVLMLPVKYAISR